MMGTYVSLAHGQFLNRENPPYLNFGWLDYRSYRENVPIYRQFDYFGNFLVEGFDAFSWDEYRTIRPEEGSILIKGKMYQQWLNRLIIARDAFAGWSTRLTVGDGVRTVFTPLTMNLTRFNGIRWDMASDNNRFTILGSRTSDPVRLWYLQPLGMNLIKPVKEGLYLLGGHWESYLGGFLRLGATYINMHRYDSFRTAEQNSWKGVAVRDAIPDTIVVRFEDDSPDDGIGGACVFYIYGIVKVRLGERTVVQKIEPYQVVLSPGAIWHAEAGYWEASGWYQADGYKLPVYVDFVFPMPSGTYEAEFFTLVANDYRICVRQSHRFLGKWVTQFPPSARDPFFPFFPIRRAQGNVRDMTNKRVVRFQYGMVTGMDFLGLDFELNLAGFRLRGEVVRNISHFQYPVLIGSWSSYKDYAYYLIATKEIKPFSFGAEWFSIGPKYNGYDWGQDYLPFERYFTKKWPAPEELKKWQQRYKFHPHRGHIWYFNEAREDPIALQAWRETMFNPVYYLVEDNDDNDIWPDDWVQDWDVTTPERFFEPEAGIFPGWDKDGDGIPDYNRNNNPIPDWEEPFLQYYAEPIEFQYGDDNNNNFIIDAFEDDMLPDYPYYKDETGRSFYVSFAPIKGLKLTWGKTDIHQVAGGGINKMEYGKLNYSRKFTDKGEIWFEHMIKRVKDDIRNDWYQFTFKKAIEPLERVVYTQQRFEDPLMMKNSLVNRGFLATRFSPIPNLNIINNLRYEINKQYASKFEDGTSQDEDRMEFIGVVNKADYTFKWKNLIIMPQLKLQYQRWRWKSEENPFVDSFLLIPILRANYLLTKRTSIQFGIQGFPLLPNRHWDRANDENTYSSRNFIFLLSNYSYYRGYKVCAQVGWQYNSIDFDDPCQRDTDFYRFFVRFTAGIEQK